LPDISNNPNIIWNYIINNFDMTDKLGRTWYINGLFLNPFTLQLELIKKECILKWMLVKKIQRWFRTLSCNPEYKLCQKRLIKIYYKN
jgi:hypothetical protein